MTAQQEKSQLRCSWLKLRAARGEAWHAAGPAIVRKLARHPLILAASHIGVFYPRPYECDILALWEIFPARCLFPQAVPSSRTLGYFPIDRLTDLEPGFRGIREPRARPGKQILWASGDVVLVPGLCFDRQGGRLGSGMGFFDRFLAGLTADLGLSVRKIGVCAQDQVVHRPLAQQDTDVRMDALCTELGVVECTGSD